MPNSALELIKDIRLITQKELLYASRDPDVLIYTVLVPLVIYPVLFIGTNDLVMWIAGQFERQVSKIAVEHVDDGRYELAVRAAKSIPQSQVITPPDAMADLKAGKLDAYVTFEPPAAIWINVSQSNLIDKTATKIVATIYTKRYEERKAFEQKSGLSDKELQVFDVEQVDIAPSESGGEIRRVEELGGVPLPLMVLFAFVWVHIGIGMGPPATIMFAEQREKKTMETTLLEPVTRGALVGAKFFTTWLIGLLAGFMYSLGIAITLATVAAALAFRAFGPTKLSKLTTGVLHMPYVATESWLLLALTVIVNTAFCAMVYLAAGSRSTTFKQAQALITIPMLLVIMLPFAAFIPGVELTAATAFAPVLNMFLVIKRGDPNLALTAISVGWNLLLIVVAWMITTRMVSAEKSHSA